MPFDIKKIREDAKKNFQETWIRTAELIPEKSVDDYMGGKGRLHPIHELVQKTRRVFVDLGFDEIENPMFITEEDVYKQYGPEAPVILDRVYYLAGLPRPDIGLGQKKIEDIKKINKKIDIDELKRIFREYREGSIEGDDIIEKMVNRLGVGMSQGARILDLFPEFRDITPQPSKLTLRSHMTGAWFPTLAALVGEPLPQRLFSVGLRFRREQKVDATHLRAHYGGSMVIADEDVSLNAGIKLTEKIMGGLGFDDLNFVQKKATSNYYTPGTEYEVYSGNIEIADIGMYSPVALVNYDIPYNVFNLGFGLERTLMVQKNIKDVRELLYPQLYKVVELNDKEIAEKITVDLTPKSVEGKKIAEAIKKTAIKHAKDKSPCSFKAYEGSILGKKIKVDVLEKEENTSLLGPAALNDIYVHDGSIYGLPEDTSNLKCDVSTILQGGIKLDFSVIDSLSNYFAVEIEDQIKAGKKEGFIQVKMAKSPADVNIKIDETTRQFISSKNKKISVKGPIFTAVEYRLYQ